MPVRRRFRAYLLSVAVPLVVLGAATVARPAPADAACDYADVWITWSGGGETNVTPWPRGCALPTNWPYLTQPSGGDHEGWVPPGLPNGVQFQVGVTSP